MESAASKIFACELCAKVFSTKYILDRHLKNNNCKNVLEYGFDDCLFKCLEDGCNVSFKTNKELRIHLTAEHGLGIVKNSMQFPRFEEFEAWLCKEEKKENVRYFKNRGSKRNAENTSEKLYLYCSRTGKERLVSEVSRKRGEWSQGSSKLNSGCTSQIIVTKNILTNMCFVEYYSTHYGHQEEIQHLRISKQCRKEVSSKLMMGVSKTSILDYTRGTIGEHLNRDDILNRHDINNIKVAYKIDITEGCRHQDDATSVNLWVQECKQSDCSPVLFFKPQGELSPQYSFLNANDFCLIVMSVTQIDMFKKFGSKMVCIDGTHGMNAYDFELTTLLVVDEFGEGFPVAFMFSNRKDTLIYECFFSCIKHIVFCNDMVPAYNIFMSDMANVYYNAWVAVMGQPNKQLYCSWHVDRAWQQNLSKVNVPEKKSWIYKTLKYLQTCLQENIFEKEMETFLDLLNNDPETKNMGDYLKSCYYDNRFQWAYCYRKSAGINTNMHLESFHKVIKYIYLEGKKTKRLDKALHALQKYIRDKVFDRIIKLTKGKCNEHLNKIKNRHRVAITHPLNFSLIEDNVYESFSQETNMKYTIKKNQENICCALVCHFCNICIHSFECSCIDYSVGSTICKHIHSFNIKYNNENNAPAIDTSEIKKLVTDVSNSSPIATNKSRTNKLDTIRSEALQLLSNLNSLNYTDEEQTHLIRNLKVCNSLGSTSPHKENIHNFMETSSFPSNQKIEKQKFFSTKKKQKPKKNISKPNFKELEIIKNTLSQNIYISDDSKNDHLYN